MNSLFTPLWVVEIVSVVELTFAIVINEEWATNAEDPLFLSSFISDAIGDEGDWIVVRLTSKLNLIEALLTC